MSGIVRDFSQQSINDILDIIDKKVENDDEWGVVDWFKDTFLMEELDIKQYVDNVNTYHENVIDKHNIGVDKFDTILQKVHTVDQNYGYQMYCVYDTMESFNTKIKNIADMITPAVITANTSDLQAIADHINEVYETDKSEIEEVSNSLKESIKDTLYEAPWWEKALNAVGGFGVYVIVDAVVEPAIAINQALYAVTGGWIGMDSIDADWARDGIDQYIVDNFVTDETWYYGGRVAGDVVGLAVGVAEILGGIAIMAGGVTLTAGGAILSGTGVGAVVGAPAIAVSIPVVATGAAVAVAGVSTAAGSLNNMQDNIQKFQNSGNSNSSSNRSVRETLLDKVENQKLKNAINQIYRPGATVGDGGLADAVRHELETGELVGGKSHIQKATERVKNLENIINSQSLSGSDLEIATNLLNDLKNALGGM